MNRHPPPPEQSPPYWLTCFFVQIETRGYQAVVWSIYILYSLILNSLISIDLSASNDIRMKLQGHVEERNSKFPQSQFSFLDLITTHQLQLYHQLLDNLISIYYRGNFRVKFPSDEKCRLHLCLLHHFLKSIHQF